jgi:CBS domain-containing protein
VVLRKANNARNLYAMEGIHSPPTRILAHCWKGSHVNASQIMQQLLLTANGPATASEAAAHMTSTRVSGFPVVDENRVLIGRLTEFDLIRAVHAGLSIEATLVREIISRDVITVDPDDTMDAIMAILEQHRIIRVPVVRDGELLGIVSHGDILRAALALPA